MGPHLAAVHHGLGLVPCITVSILSHGVEEVGWWVDADYEDGRIYTGSWEERVDCAGGFIGAILVQGLWGRIAAVLRLNHSIWS